jgi:hypothetical protein
MHTDIPVNAKWDEITFYLKILVCVVKFGINVVLSYISMMIVSLELNKASESYLRHIETVFKASRSERIVQNVRNGYGILNS